MNDCGGNMIGDYWGLVSVPPCATGLHKDREGFVNSLSIGEGLDGDVGLSDLVGEVAEG